MYALLLCLSFSSLSAQSLLQHVPQDASFVFTLNPDHLNKKIPLVKLKEYNIYQMAMSQLAQNAGQQVVEMIEDPGKYGLDLMSASHVFGKVLDEDGGILMGVAFQLSDAAKFRQAISDQLGTTLETEKRGDFEVFSMGSSGALAWNNNKAIVAGGEARGQNPTQEWMNTVLNGNKGNSISTNAKYSRALKGKTSDASLWMDYGAFATMYSQMGMGMMPADQRMIMEMMMGMYEGMHIAAHMNFDQGAMRVNYETFVNDELSKIFQGMTNASFNQKFAQYIPKNNLMAYINFNYNLEEMVNGTRSLMEPMLNQIPEYGPMINDAMDIIGIAVDEQALYNLWSGDMFLGVTGMRDFKKTITTYDYDEEFNRIEVEREVEEKLPEFTMMMSYSNEADVMKFVKLGLHSPYLESKGAYYQINVPDMPMDAFMAMKDGVFFITNNQDFIENKLSAGFGKGERISKEHLDRIQKSAQVVYWDVPNTVGVMEKLEGMNEGPMKEVMDASKKSVKSMILKADKAKGDVFSQEFSINFMDGGANSLDQLFSYLDKVMKTMMGTSM